MIEMSEKMYDEVCLISLKGKLSGCPETEDLYFEFKKLREKEIRKIVVDLGGVTWMGSLGLGALIGCLTATRNAGGDLRLSCLNEKLQNLLDITRLTGVFDIYPTTDQAIASYKPMYA